MLARMNRPMIWLGVITIALALSACSTVVVEAPGTARGAGVAHAAAPGGTYVVAKGDTLYAIAFRKGVDFRDLAKWNNIAPPYTIWPGQSLHLAAPGGGSPAAGHAIVAAPAPAAPVEAAKPEATSAAPVFENVTPAPAAGTSSAAVAATGTKPATSSVPAPSPATPAPAPAPAPVAAPVPAPTVSNVVPVAGEPKAATPPPAPAVVGGSSRSAGGVTWRWPASGAVITRFTPGDAVPGIEIAGKAGDPVRAAADGVVVYSGNGLVGYGELVIIKHSDSLLSAYGHNSKRLVKEGQRVTAGQEIALMGSSGASRVELGFQIRKDGNPVDPMSYLPAR